MESSKQFVLDIRKPEAPQDDKQQSDSTTNKFTRQFKIRHILGCPRSTRRRRLLEILTTGKGDDIATEKRQVMFVNSMSGPDCSLRKLHDVECGQNFTVDEHRIGTHRFPWKSARHVASASLLHANEKQPKSSL